MRKQVSGLTLTLLMLGMLGLAFNMVKVQPVRAQLEADAHTLALWHFNEGSGQIVYDESSYHNDGTLGPTSNVEAKDPSWAAGFTGQPGDYAVSMDDWYDYVNIPDNPDDSLDLLCGDQFTIEFWTYVRQVSRSGRGNSHQWNHFLSKYPFGTPYSAYFMYQCSYYPFARFGFYDSTSTYCTTGCLPPPTHQWVHVMIAYDGQYLRIYYDDVLQSEADVGHHYVLGNNRPLAIGDNQNNDYPWTDGVDCIIDEVRLSSVARAPPIDASVDIDPDTLNLKSNGQWIIAHIELPGDHDVSAIDVASIALTVEGQDFAVDPAASTAIGDYDLDGISDLAVKFDRVAVRNHLGEV
ncbi:MAG: LamG domain-containing protein, partial [Candidatus Bathyarchaeota archaeon]